MLTKHICAVDIGSSKIAGAVARVKKGDITGLSLGCVDSCGVRNGAVVDPVAFVDGLGCLLKELKKDSGFNFRSVYVNISGADISIKRSRAIIPLAERGNKIVSASDIQRVNEQALVLGADMQEEVLHKLASSYTLDNKVGILNPAGLYGHRIETELLMVCAKNSSVDTLTHLVSQTGNEVNAIFLSGMATYKTIPQEKIKTGINILCDIGSDITEILIFQDGSLKAIEMLSAGGNDITVSLAEALKIPLELAEELKVSYAVVGDIDPSKPDKEILIKKEGLYEPVKQRVFCEIATSCARSLFGKIRNAIEKHAACTQVKSMFVCGRTVLQEGFLEAMETTLCIETRLCKLWHPKLSGFSADKEALQAHKYLAYLTVLGMLLRAVSPEEISCVSQKGISSNPVIKAINTVREIYQEYF